MDDFLGYFTSSLSSATGSVGVFIGNNLPLVLGILFGVIVFGWLLGKALGAFRKRRRR